MLASTLCPCRTSFNAAGTVSNLMMRTSTAHISTGWKRGNKDGNKDSKVPKDETEKVPLPEFQVLLRQLYRKSHPDLLRASHPEAAEVNDTSMQLLNGILSTIKKYNQYPAQIVKTIPFNVKSGDKVIVVNLRIQTAGGDCRRALTGSFRDFFFDTGIISCKVGAQFAWGKDYFPKVPGENDEEEKETAEA